jgi:hypothetical protein
MIGEFRGHRISDFALVFFLKWGIDDKSQNVAAGVLLNPAGINTGDGNPGFNRAWPQCFAGM